MNPTALALAGLAVALTSGFAASQFQRGIDRAECAKEVALVRKGAIDALNLQGQELLTVTAERDQAKAEVDKINATTAAQFLALQTMLEDDKVRRDEASARVEAAAREASRNAKTAGDRATALRDVMDKITDQCAGASIPPDVERMLDGILRPGSASAPMVSSAMPGATGQVRP